MLRRPLERGQPTQGLLGVLIVGGGDVHDAHASGGQSAGLVEDDRVDALRGFQGRGSRHQDAELGRAAGTDEDRDRGGQAQRARAGDDEHRDSGGEAGRQRLPARSQPRRVSTASTITTGTKTPRCGRRGAARGLVPSCASSTRRAMRARRVLLTHPRRTHDEPSARGDGAAVTVDPDPRRPGRLPGQHALVHRALPSSTSPSVATVDPGRTTNSSPTELRDVDATPVDELRLPRAEVEQ